MIDNGNDDESTPLSPSSPATPKADDSPGGGFLPGHSIEVAAAGTGTTNDPSGTDTRPPGGAPPP